MVKLIFGSVFSSTDASYSASRRVSKNSLKKLRIRGHSMEPAIRHGAIVWGQPAHESELAVGDVVTYLDAKNRLVTHRIVSMVGSDLRCKYCVCGDFYSNCEVVDKTAIVYKILKVENMGFAYDVDSPFGKWVKKQALQHSGYWTALQKMTFILIARPLETSGA